MIRDAKRREECQKQLFEAEQLIAEHDAVEQHRARLAERVRAALANRAQLLRERIHDFDAALAKRAKGD